MAALESTKFIPFTFPPPFCNNQSLWPAKTSRPIYSLNTSSSQKIRRPATTFPQSGCRAEAYENTAARAEDNDLPSFEELFSIAPPPKISTKASKTERTLQHLKQPALGAARIQADQTKSAAGDNPDQPMILNDDDSDKASAGDEAKGAISDVDTGRVERDASPHNTLVTSELALEPGKSIDASGSWYGGGDGCYIDEPAPRLGSCEQHSVPSAPAQDQTQILSQSSTPLQDQINQQDIDDIIQSMSVGSAPHSLPKPSNNGDDGWTDDSMAELEKELGLALEEEQVESSSASAPTSPSPRSVEAPQDEIQNQERSETTGSKLEELRNVCQRGTPAQGLEWEQQETRVVVETLGGRELGKEVLVGEAGGVEIQQQGELAGQPALSGQQNLAEVDDTNDPMGKEATEALPTTQLEVDSHHFRLRGIRTQQLGRRQTKTTQYRVVWGEHPNRSDSWINDDDVQISMLWLPWKRSSHDLVPQVERDVVRVHRMRCSKRSKGKKIFEYLVDELSTWITEDQLRISLSPTLLAQLKASSTDPLSPAQSEVYPMHLAAPINDEHRHISRTSRSPSTPSSPADPALEGEPATRKRGHQDSHTEISSVTHHSANTDDDHNTCDTNDEDPRPAKRRKPHSAPAVTPPPHLRRSRPFKSTSTTSLEIDDMQPQADFGCPSTLVDDELHYTPQTSRSPSASVKSVPIAGYQEWPFQGFLKRTRIGNETTYNLEFQLSHVPEHLHLPVLSEALGMRSKTSAEAVTPHNPVVHSEVRPATFRGKRKRVPWKPEENETILKMKKEGCSWEEIHRALPDRTPGAIQVQYSTKLKK